MKTIRQYFSAVCLATLFAVIATSCGSDDDNNLPQQFTVTFDSQGGSNVAAMTVEDGTKIKVPTAPTKDRSIFVGWYKENNYTNIWNFESDIVVKNITLYAKWQQVDYTVTFNTNGGNTITPQGVAEGGCAVKPLTPTKVGNAFEGWYTDAALTNEYNFSTPVTGDLNLYAKWAEINLESLTNLITEASQLNSNNYEVDSYNEMYTKLQNARQVANSSSPTSSQIYDAYQALINAINQLVEKPYRATVKLGFNPMPVDGFIYVTAGSEEPFYLFANGLDANNEQSTNCDVNFTYSGLESWAQDEITKDNHQLSFMIKPTLAAGTTIDIKITSVEFPSVNQTVTLKVIGIDELKTKFIETVNVLPTSDQIGPDNYDNAEKAVDEAFRLYNSLSEEGRQDADIIAAFEKLLTCSRALENIAKFSYSFTGNRCEFTAYGEAFYCDYESKGQFPVGAYTMIEWEKDGNKYYNSKIELKSDNTFQVYYRTSTSADGKNPTAWDEEEEGTYSFTGNKTNGGTVFMVYEYDENDYRTIKSASQINKLKATRHSSSK
ncbi:InlB B-repeat-containing protein [Bacteroides sp.]|uniref:InlB B-repeat-containing protein n=1 Tax=Bacteroides sp. TaxID=29523 RepID=UPI0026184DF2|nr:InlB B-repeat-containing protein [Bacteroides sp.]MDD3037485.1 InlB B-repeat-containing protein [Bacteroides sp.]